MEFIQLLSSSNLVSVELKYVGLDHNNLSVSHTALNLLHCDQLMLIDWPQDSFDMGPMGTSLKGKRGQWVQLINRFLSASIQ